MFYRPQKVEALELAGRSALRNQTTVTEATRSLSNRIANKDNHTLNHRPLLPLVLMTLMLHVR
jgi:hypothetical protein